MNDQHGCSHCCSLVCLQQHPINGSINDHPFPFSSSMHNWPCKTQSWLNSHSIWHLLNLFLSLVFPNLNFVLMHDKSRCCVLERLQYINQQKGVTYSINHIYLCSLFLLSSSAIKQQLYWLHCCVIYCCWCVHIDFLSIDSLRERGVIMIHLFVCFCQWFVIC